MTHLAVLRTAAPVLAAVMIAIGAIWIGQGFGYLGGTFMTGQAQWAWIGTAVFGGGVGPLFVKVPR